MDERTDYAASIAAHEQAVRTCRVKRRTHGQQTPPRHPDRTGARRRPTMPRAGSAPCRTRRPAPTRSSTCCCSTARTTSDQLHALMSTGLPTAQLAQLPGLPRHARRRHRAAARDRAPRPTPAGPGPQRLAAPASAGSTPSTPWPSACAARRCWRRPSASSATATNARPGSSSTAPPTRPSEVHQDLPMPILDLASSVHLPPAGAAKAGAARPRRRAAEGRSFGAELDRSRAAQEPGHAAPPQARRPPARQRASRRRRRDSKSELSASRRAGR